MQIAVCPEAGGQSQAKKIGAPGRLSGFCGLRHQTSSSSYGDTVTKRVLNCGQKTYQDTGMPSRLNCQNHRPKLILLSATMLFMAVPATAADLPMGFVRLSAVAPRIEQDIRYHGNHNFVGRPIAGYEAGECILTRQAATALVAVARDLEPEGLGLKLYDCYRPVSAVANFAAWASDMNDLDMQAEFYPRVAKADLFDLGYIANHSGHSRGSTVDLAIRHLDQRQATPWHGGERLLDCTLPENERFADGILDFGTGYDCFDVKAHHGAEGIEPHAAANREKLAVLMAKHGFKRYDEEWWHYTLVNEPFPVTYFEFPVTAAWPEAR